MKVKGKTVLPPSAGQTLPRGEEAFRPVVEGIQEVFWMTDATKTRMLYISPAYEHIWGRPCQELYDSPHVWADSVHPEDRVRVLQRLLARQLAGEYDEEYRIVHPSGQVRWIHDRAFPVKGAAGKVTRIVGIVEDITERKGTEELLDTIGAARRRERPTPAERRELEEWRRHYQQLTPREREVMALITAGMLNKQAAGALATTMRTVKFHRANIMRKMRAKSLAELVRMAEKLGVCSLS